MRPLLPPAVPTPEDFAFSRLIAYAAYQWPGYKDAAHHRAIARKLEAVERGDIKRLMIFMPPRHGKSMLASEFFPSWYLGRNPSHYVIASTYAQELADDFGRKVKGLIEDPAYGAIFPGVKLAADSQSVKRFHVEGGGLEVGTAQKGAYYAVGVGGPLTGRGAHCMAAGTKVLTSIGNIAIDYLEYCPASVKIVSLNTKRGEIEYTDIEAFRSRPATWIYRITTASGRVVEATGNHPFYVNGGYVQADQLAAGDSLLLALPDRLSKDRSGRNESDAPGFSESVLFRKMCARAVQRGMRALQGLRRTNREADEPLLRQLPSKIQGARSGLSRAASGLRAVWQWVFGEVARHSIWQVGVVLLENLCGYSPRQAHVGGRQPEVEGWGNTSKRAASFRSDVQGHAQAGSRARHEYVSDLRDRQEAACASFGQLAGEQLRVEPGDYLCDASPAVASGVGIKAVRDSVALVERVRKETRVFDIQVSKNHNFFANGVLVHNCLLIDDPIKNREEADSEIFRKRLQNWYTSTAYTRLMPGARVVVIQTRWHEMDLSGWLLENHKHEGWDVLDLPALSEDGKALWPEQYPVESLARIKAAVGTRDWSALYQQKPAPDAGDYFKREWFKYYDEQPDLLQIYGVSDYAITSKGGDYTVHGVFGVDPQHNIYLLDLWRQQAASDVWIDVFLDLVDKWKPVQWGEEQGQIIKSLDPFINKRSQERGVYVAREQFTSLTDKSSRAQSIRGRMAQGKVYLKRGAPYLDSLERELLTFPVGANDDQVDIFSLFGRMLDKLSSKARPAPVKERDRWDRAFNQDDDEDSWKTT